MVQNEYFKCAEIPILTCEHQCNLGCQYVSCMRNFTDNNFLNVSNETYGMCLPKNLNETELYTRCDSVSHTDVVTGIDECENFVPRIIAESKKIHILIIIVAVSFLLFVVSLICYRWRVLYHFNLFLNEGYFY